MFISPFRCWNSLNTELNLVQLYMYLKQLKQRLYFLTHLLVYFLLLFLIVFGQFKFIMSDYLLHMCVFEVRGKRTKLL